MTDRKDFEKRFTELSPIIYYCDIDKGVSLSVLRKRPEGKVYAYCDVLREQCFELILNLTDGCVDCRYGDSFDGADEWTEKILKKVLELGGRMDWYAKYWQAEKDGNWPMQMPLDEKLTTGFIEAYIPSKDTAAYLRSINHQFSDAEKATIIVNHENLTREKKLEAFQRLRGLSEDEALCRQLDTEIQLICNHKEKYLLVRDAFYQFFPIPHDFRHGDIVHFVSNLSRKKLGVILGYSEDDYKLYRKLERRYADYSDVQIPAQTPFTTEVYGAAGDSSYEYRGELDHVHENPIYIERARLSHDNSCGQYLEYLANIGTPKERESHLLAQKVIAREVEKVWSYYPKMNLAELTSYAAKAGKLLLIGNLSETAVKELISLPEADDIDVCKTPDYELMHGLWMLRQQKERERNY